MVISIAPGVTAAVNADLATGAPSITATTIRRIAPGIEAALIAADQALLTRNAYLLSAGGITQTADIAADLGV
jgi:hypothetical protein